MKSENLLKVLRNKGFAGLEKAVFEQVSLGACAEVTEVLRSLDDELMKIRPRNLRLVGFRERTVVTLFGDLIIKRRLYRMPDGSYVFLLDGFLDIEASDRVSENVQKIIAELSKQVSYREVSRILEKFLPSHVAHQTVHRLAREKGKECYLKEIEADD